MATPTLKARVRTDAELGSRACRKLRGGGEVPVNLISVVQGEKTKQTQNQSLAVSAFELYKLIDRHADIIDLDLNGTIDLVRVTEVQRDTFGDDVLHLDMMSIDPNAPVTAKIPLEFTGKPKGITDMSLVTINAREVEVACKPREIPTLITVDLGLASAGENLMSGTIPLPAGSTLAGAEISLATVGKAAGA